MRGKCVIAGMCLLSLVSSLSAQLDPEPKTPYRVQVVLAIVEHRVFTPLFQEQLLRDLKNRMQAELGALGVVEVARQHPLLRKITTDGLEAALDSWEEVSDRRTCFVQLAYDRGEYRIETRFFDGPSGLPGPLVQRTRTSDRGLVLANAVDLLARDFSVSATVDRKGADLFLALRGGALEASQAGRVRIGDVFVVSRLTREGPRLASRRVPWALVEVTGTVQEGKCRARLWHRFQEDDLRSEAGVLGYRAVRWPTVKAVPKLQLLDDKSQQPLEGVRVQFTQPGESKVQEVVTDRNGFAAAPEPIAQFTLVKALQGERVVAQFPLEIIHDRPVPCRLSLKAEAPGQAAFELRRGLFLRRLLDNLRWSGERFEEVQRRLGESLPAALQHAQQGLAQIDEELGHLTGEAVQLQKLAKGIKDADSPDFPLRLEELRRNRDELQRFVERVASIVKDAPQGELAVNKMLEQARLFEVQGEFDQALAMYGKVLALRPDQKTLRTHADTLRWKWQPKGDKHIQARRFLEETWPRVEVGELKEQMTKANEALTACKEAGDRLVVVKLRRANAAHAAKLKSRLDQLLKNDTEDNRNQIQVIRAAAEALSRFHRDADSLLSEPRP